MYSNKNKLLECLVEERLDETEKLLKATLKAIDYMLSFTLKAFQVVRGAYNVPLHEVR